MNTRSEFDSKVIESEKKEFNNEKIIYKSYNIPSEYIGTPTNGEKCCYSNMDIYGSYGYREIKPPVPVTSLPLFTKY
jgi:hypothetical protein